MKGQNFASQVLSRHTLRISRKKGSDFFDHRGTLKFKKLKCFVFEISSVENFIPTSNEVKISPFFTSKKNWHFTFNFFARGDVQTIFGGKFQGKPFRISCPKSCQGKRCANFSKFSRQKS